MLILSRLCSREQLPIAKQCSCILSALNPMLESERNNSKPKNETEYPKNS